MNWEITDLDCAEILAACVSCVPVNTRLNQAVAAHRIAFEASQRDPEARQLAEYTLRCVVMARTTELGDIRAQLDYLEALPETAAWPSGAEYSARECREETLAGIRRLIRLLSACG